MMDGYIYIFIATRIVIQKQKKYDFAKWSVKEIKNALGEKINISFFDVVEDQETVVFIIKESILEDYLYDYLYEQSFGLFYGQQIRNDILKLKKRDGKDILRVIRDDDLDYVHYISFNQFQTSYLLKNAQIYMEGIEYLSEGKVHMENYEELMSYIYLLIQKSSSNPIKSLVCIKII